MATIIYIRNIMLIVKNRGQGVEDSGSLIATARAPGHNDNRDSVNGVQKQPLHCELFR